MLLQVNCFALSSDLGQYGLNLHSQWKTSFPWYLIWALHQVAELLGL